VIADLAHDGVGVGADLQTSDAATVPDGVGGQLGEDQHEVVAALASKTSIGRARRRHGLSAAIVYPAARAPASPLPKVREIGPCNSALGAWAWDAQVLPAKAVTFMSAAMSTAVAYDASLPRLTRGPVRVDALVSRRLARWPVFAPIWCGR